MPDYEDKDELSNWIDNNISAELPLIDEFQSEEDIQYHDLVQKYMIHKCSSAEPNGCLDEEGKCSKYFTCNKIQSTTTFNERGFPEYKRLSANSLKIVPHNKKILLAWNGHANVKFAGSTFLVIYLYKVQIYYS